MNNRFSARFFFTLSIGAVAVFLCSCSEQPTAVDRAQSDDDAQRIQSIADPAPERDQQGIADEFDYIYSSQAMAAFYEKVQRAEVEMYEEFKKIGKTPVYASLPASMRMYQLLRIMVYERHGSDPLDRLKPGDRELLRERLPTGLKWLDHIQAKPLTEGTWVDPLLRQYDAESTLAFLAREIREWDTDYSEHVAMLIESLKQSFEAQFLAERIRGMKEPQEQKAAKDELRVLLRDCLDKILACRYITLRRTETDIADVRELLAKAKAAGEPAKSLEEREAAIANMKQDLEYELAQYDLLKANFDMAVECGMARMIYGGLMTSPFDL